LQTTATVCDIRKNEAAGFYVRATINKFGAAVKVPIFLFGEATACCLIPWAHATIKSQITILKFQTISKFQILSIFPPFLKSETNLDAG